MDPSVGISSGLSGVQLGPSHRRAGSIFWDFLKALVSFPSTSESLSCGTPASIGAKV